MRNLSLFLLFTLFSLVIACKKKTEEATPAPTLADKLAEKEWTGDKAKIDGTNPQNSQPISQELPITTIKLKFNSDKTFTLKAADNAEPQKGSWEMLDNYTKIKLTGGFQTIFNSLIDPILATLPLPAGTTITSVKIPEIFDVKKLIDTDLVIKGVTTINLAVAAGPFTIPVAIPMDTELSFKR